MGGLREAGVLGLLLGLPGVRGRVSVAVRGERLGQRPCSVTQPLTAAYSLLEAALAALNLSGTAAHWEIFLLTQSVHGDAQHSRLAPETPVAEATLPGDTLVLRRRTISFRQSTYVVPTPKWP